MVSGLWRERKRLDVPIVCIDACHAHDVQRREKNAPALLLLNDSELEMLILKFSGLGKIRKLF
jgi:hypothetical protein